MIRILSNVWYPVDKIKDVYKQFLEVEKVFPMPSLIKPATPWETWATKSGVKGSGIFVVEDDDFEVAIDYFVRRLNLYANAIEGYRYELAAPYDNEKGKSILGKDPSELLLKK